jgi:class 3 adenylate cyclase
MSRGTRIRGVIRVAIAGTAQDNAISPNAVQEAINRHFTLLGDTASQYGGTVEHLSGSERLYLFLDGPKTVGAANAILAAAVSTSHASSTRWAGTRWRWCWLACRTRG